MSEEGFHLFWSDVPLRFCVHRLYFVKTGYGMFRYCIVGIFH